MQTETNQSLDSDGIVEHKVRRRVAKKVLKDIHQQVDEIEQQVAGEDKAGRWLLPGLAVLALLLATLLLWPQILRLVSALIN